MHMRIASCSSLLGLLVLAVGNVSAGMIFTNIADTSTTAPGHTAFTSFGTTPSVSGSNVAFLGGYSGGSGIYTGSVGATGATKIVDFTDTAPGHTAFTGFGNPPSVSGSNVAFFGLYSGGRGIYTGSVGATGATKIVDTTDTAPGQTAFTNFGAPSVSGSNVAFLGLYGGGGGRGIYTGSVGATGATKIVDLTDTAPGHTAFTSFGPPSVSGSNVAFTWKLQRRRRHLHRQRGRDRGDQDRGHHRHRAGTHGLYRLWHSLGQREQRCVYWILQRRPRHLHRQRGRHRGDQDRGLHRHRAGTHGLHLALALRPRSAGATSRFLETTAAAAASTLRSAAH